MKVTEQTGLTPSDFSRLKRLADPELVGEIIKLNRTEKYRNKLDVVRVCSILKKFKG